MIDEIFSAIGEMFSLLFHGLWELTKLLSKLFYHFLKRHPRYACLLPILIMAVYLRFSYLLSSSDFFTLDPQDGHLFGSLLSGKLLLLGPLLLPANITLGPFYEYLIAPTFWIFGVNPVGPAFISALAAIGTVYLLYLIGKQFFNLQAGLFAAGLYAASSFIVSYQHLSWNIDMLPFFSLLLIWLIFNAAASARPVLYYLSAGYVLGLCLQLQYISLFLVPLILIYMVITEVLVKGKKFFVPFILHFFQFLLGFFISFVFFLYFEFTNGFSNTKLLVNYLVSTAHAITLSQFLFSLPQTFFTFFARLVVNFPSQDAIIYYSTNQVTILSYFAIFLFVVSFLFLFFARNRFVILVLLLWLAFGVISLNFFSKDIYDFHFSLLYPLIFLLIGNFLSIVFHFADQERVKLAKQLISQTAESESYTMIPVDATDNKKLFVHIVSIILSLLIFFIIVLLNLSVLPYHYHNKQQRNTIKDIASSIVQKANKSAFNFAYLTTPNISSDPNAYVQAMAQLGNKPVTILHPEIDPDRKTVTDFLYVVCEGLQCKPLESTVWYVQGFGDAAILVQWNVDDAKVYKLVPVINR